VVDGPLPLPLGAAVRALRDGISHMDDMQHPADGSSTLPLRRHCDHVASTPTAAARAPVPMRRVQPPRRPRRRTFPHHLDAIATRVTAGTRATARWSGRPADLLAHRPRRLPDRVGAVAGRTRRGDHRSRLPVKPPPGRATLRVGRRRSRARRPVRPDRRASLCRRSGSAQRDAGSTNGIVRPRVSRRCEPARSPAPN
jgi:hypothetical protein